MFGRHGVNVKGMSQDMVRQRLVISSVYELPLNLIVFPYTDTRSRTGDSECNKNYQRTTSAGG